MRLDAAVVAATPDLDPSKLAPCSPQGPSPGKPCLSPQGRALFCDSAGGVVDGYLVFYAADGQPSDTPAGPPDSVRGSWAEPELWALAAQHVLPDGATPDGAVDRGQGIVALVEELGLLNGYSGQTIALPDVPASSPYFQAAGATLGAGVLESDRPFDPDAPLTRQQLITWVVRALGYGPLIGMPNRVEVGFSDATALDPATANAVGIAQGLGILTGWPDGAFHGDASVHWADLAAILARAAGPGGLSR